MLTFLVLGAGIGFVAGISPGPVLTLVATETLKSGWLRGAAVAAGPLLADGPIVLIAVTVFSDLPPTVVPAISMLGGPTMTQARVVGWPAVAAFLLGYYATIVGSNVGLALALHRWIGLLSQRIYRGILLGASALLAVYGFVLIGRPNPSEHLPSPAINYRAAAVAGIATRRHSAS